MNSPDTVSDLFFFFLPAMKVMTLAWQLCTLAKQMELTLFWNKHIACMRKWCAYSSSAINSSVHPGLTTLLNTLKISRGKETLKVDVSQEWSGISMNRSFDTFRIPTGMMAKMKKHQLYLPLKYTIIFPCMTGSWQSVKIIIILNF